MRDKYGDRFKAGVVLYTGRQTIPLGDRIWAGSDRRPVGLTLSATAPVLLSETHRRA
jgi:hypothetical protein